MKAILVVDIPKSCEDCPCYYEGTFYCPLLKRDFGIWYARKPVDCPLKPMPSKRETQVHWKSIGGGDIPTHEISEYDKGWNDCVEMLEGENYE